MSVQLLNRQGLKSQQTQTKEIRILIVKTATRIRLTERCGKGQILMYSNGKNLKDGDFEGSVRNMSCGDGEIDIYTERDYSKPDAQGNGTLQNLKACTQEEFYANTVEYNTDWKGKAN